MGGSSVDEEWELSNPVNGVRTVVLVGRTGNGKSALGNSLLGAKSFISKSSASGVTTCTVLRRTITTDGQILNVIDTPGFYDSVHNSEYVGKEIAKVIDLAKDGIHAILVVFSIRTRFSEEEALTLTNLRTLFGAKITDYVIVVFTGGDDLDDDQTLEDYLGSCPDALKKILEECENRKTLFDNKTGDEDKKRKQVALLMSLVNDVVIVNNGKPYSNELFSELKEGAEKLRALQEKVSSLKGYSTAEISQFKELIDKAYLDHQLARMAAMVELQLKSTISGLEENLRKEREERMNALEEAKYEKRNFNDLIKELRIKLENAEKENANLLDRINNDPILKITGFFRKIFHL